MSRVKSRRTPTSTWSRVALRCLLVLVLIVATYNPSFFNMIEWISGRAANGETLFTPLVIIAATILLLLWAMLLVMAWKAYRWFGKVMVLIVAMLMLFTAYSVGLMDMGGFAGLQWCGIIVFAVVIGYSTMHLHVRRGIFGVVGTSEVEDAE